MKSSFSYLEGYGLTRDIQLVGTVLCIGTVAMYHSGIGGGGFMIVRGSNGSYENIDFRETAPAAAFEDMYKEDVNLSMFGGLASGVPGELRGLEYLHKHYGVLPWYDVVVPTVHVARCGFEVTPDLVKFMDSATTGPDTNNFLVDDPNWALDFAPNGTRLGLGDRLTRKRYADTLEAVALYGAHAFYSGAIARLTVKSINANNGTMTLADLANYSVVTRTPAQITYRGYKIRSCSAPASGAVVLGALKTVEGYSGFSENGPASNLSTHRLDEATRFAYGQRSQLGDPDFVAGLDVFQASMLSDKLAAEVRSKISDTRTLNRSAYDPDGLESIETPGTSHIVAADASGMAISLTTTVNLLFGSQLLVPETGIILNNEMNDFSIPGSSNAFGYIPSPSNYIRPGKRPLSSIATTIVESAHSSLPYLIIGAAGGSRIITSTLQNIVHVIDDHLTAKEALAKPRWHDQLSPNLITFEYAYDNSTTSFMEDLGHNVSWIAPGQSSANAIRIFNPALGYGGWEAIGEPRLKASGGFVAKGYET
ncbi:MAG: hypothetical protein M1814_002331 [Vezdaea aestivalis]|nr:MAG: hypothetical protein M1814_002331 [Vezdaea aestivalis]